jgi:hypothetical protein
MKKILKENITQEQIDNMQDFINMSMQVLMEIEEQTRKQVLVAVGSSFRSFVVDTLDQYYKNLK